MRFITRTVVTRAYKTAGGGEESEDQAKKVVEKFQEYKLLLQRFLDDSVELQLASLFEVLLRVA